MIVEIIENCGRVRSRGQLDTGSEQSRAENGEGASQGIHPPTVWRKPSSRNVPIGTFLQIRITASSGLQAKRTGRPVVPSPRLT